MTVIESKNIEVLPSGDLRILDRYILPKHTLDSLGLLLTPTQKQALIDVIKLVQPTDEGYELHSLLPRFMSDHVHYNLDPCQVFSQKGYIVFKHNNKVGKAKEVYEQLSRL